MVAVNQRETVQFGAGQMAYADMDTAELRRLASMTAYHCHASGFHTMTPDMVERELVRRAIGHGLTLKVHFDG